MNIGPHLKSIRLAKNYTLNDVAVKTGMSASLLSQVENGKSSPSLQSLEGLLRFYAVNFSDFFRQVEQKRFILVRKDARETLSGSSGAFTLTLLASKLQNNALESFLVELGPGAVIEIAKLGEEINGERIVLVMEGGIAMALDGENFDLAEGDSINFKAYVSCSARNRGERAAKFFISGLPPMFM